MEQENNVTRWIIEVSANIETSFSNYGPQLTHWRRVVCGTWLVFCCVVGRRTTRWQPEPPEQSHRPDRQRLGRLGHQRMVRLHWNHRWWFWWLLLQGSCWVEWGLQKNRRPRRTLVSLHYCLVANFFEKLKLRFPLLCSRVWSGTFRNGDF